MAPAAHKVRQVKSTGYFPPAENRNGRQLLGEKWIQQALTPLPAKDDGGYMNWYLNTGKRMLPSAPATAFMHIGNGTILFT